VQDDAPLHGDDDDEARLHGDDDDEARLHGDEARLHGDGARLHDDGARLHDDGARLHGGDDDAAQLCDQFWQNGKSPAQQEVSVQCRRLSGAQLLRHA